MSATTPENMLTPAIRDGISLLIFDLDGVITSEQKYWNTARLVVRELLEDARYLGIEGYFGPPDAPSISPEQFGEGIIPTSLIYAIKNRAVNSNWDVTFLAAALHITAVLVALRQSAPAALSGLFQPDAPLEHDLQRTGVSLHDYTGDLHAHTGNTLIERFLSETGDLVGAPLVEAVEPFACRVLDVPRLPFEPKGALWQLCYNLFQEWHTGARPAPFEHYASEGTIVARELIAALLQQLQQSGHYTLAIATGRPHAEVAAPLESLSLLHYFDSRRIITYGHVIEAEQTRPPSAAQSGLGKPHPFVLLRAIYPDKSPAELLAMQPDQPAHAAAAFIGDSPSDVLAARRAGCISIGVLTGLAADDAARARKRQQLYDAGCHVVLNSVLDLPGALGIAPPGEGQED
jgi:phosphoglycolate phosphatase-like HAD superfamily hydrolase